MRLKVRKVRLQKYLGLGLIRFVSTLQFFIIFGYLNGIKVKMLALFSKQDNLTSRRIFLSEL
jgi:hypothetical protein